MQLRSPGWRFGYGAAATGLALSVLTLCPDLCPKNLTSPMSPAGSAHAAEGSSAANIFVAYPPDNGKVPASSSFFIGAIAPGAGLTINGQEARISRAGFFAHVIGLQPGANRFTLQLLDRASSAQGAGRPVGVTKTMTINRDIPHPQVPVSELKVLPDSVSPAVDRGVLPGELVEFSVRATPDATVTMQLGGHVVSFYPSIALKQQVQQRKTAAKRRAAINAHAARKGTTRGAAKGGKPVVRVAAATSPSAQTTQMTQANDSVNVGLDAAYGQVYQRLPAASSDRYVGFIKVGPFDQFEQAAPVFTVEKNGHTASATSPYTVSVVKQPFLVQTTHDATIVRVGPGAGRITPLVKGVRLLADGWHGDEMRILYSANKHVYISKSGLSTGRIGWTPSTPGTSGPLPASTVRTINTRKDGYGDALLLPLSQRLLIRSSNRSNRIK